MLYMLHDGVKACVSEVYMETGATAVPASSVSWPAVHIRHGKNCEGGVSFMRSRSRLAKRRLGDVSGARHHGEISCG